MDHPLHARLVSLHLMVYTWSKSIVLIAPLVSNCDDVLTRLFGRPHRTVALSLPRTAPRWITNNGMFLSVAGRLDVLIR